MKRFITLCFLIFSPITFLRCSGQSLIGASGNGNLGIGTVEVSSLHELGDGQILAADPDGHKELTNDLGYELEVEEARINWRSLLLISEGDDPECELGHDQEIVLDGVEDLLGEDLVESVLMNASVSLVSYCQFEIVVSGELLGSWSKDGQSGDFALVETEATTIVGVFPHPLHFHGEETEAHLVFAVHYGELFAGMDFAADTPESLRAKLQDNLAHGVHQHHGDHD